ncbi:MAG TPA: RNA polymerase sigma-70 factor [Puia sp.]|jgi:RNA polymerase sigma-70 factor (family 1)|nr:RNA polymerase sigma-70 factor [Puia sp.]
MLNDEKSLFLQISKGSEDAFRMLFEQYRERLFAFAWQLSHSAVDAEEVVQDVFLRLWQCREKLADVEYPRKYIYIMTRNRVLDLLTKIARDEQLLKELWCRISEADNSTARLLEAGESQKLIQQALCLLPEKKQMIFRLSRDQGLSHQEIATDLGLSKQTVKNNITEVLKFIQHFLAQH